MLQSVLRLVLGASFLAVSVLACTPCAAQTDEIQVYDAEIARPGIFNLTLHDNFTPSGRTAPDFPDGIVPNDTLNGVPEWAYGVTDWFEAGLYLPLYSIASNLGPVLNGFKVRALFVAPDAAERTFVYGINFEFSYNARHWDPDHCTSEIRPILGWHLGQLDLIFNPILDNSYKGVSRLDFAPATRIAWKLSKTWSVAAEEYDDFGPLRSFYSGGAQSHQLFAVADWKGDAVSVEGGVGFGLTPATDNLVLKLILSKDLN